MRRSPRIAELEEQARLSAIAQANAEQAVAVMGARIDEIATELRVAKLRAQSAEALAGIATSKPSEAAS